MILIYQNGGDMKEDHETQLLKNAIKLLKLWGISHTDANSVISNPTYAQELLQAETKGFLDAIYPGK